MWVAVLGPVRAEGADGSAAALGGTRLRAVLAMLALAPGSTVHTEALIDGLWGTEPPADAANALQSLVSRLRRALRELSDDPRLLRAQDGGYLLALDAGQTDAGRFATLLAAGRAELAADRPADAAATLDTALALWRGDPLSDLAGVPFAGAARDRLAEQRLTATTHRAEAALRLGAPEDALAVTEGVAPLHEPLVALRMRALHASGRQSDALALFERTRTALADELGVDPAAELRAAHAEVLRGDAHRGEPAAAPPPLPPRRDHLPPRLTSFVGREDDLAALTDRLAGARLLTVVGPGGAGKTSLTIELLRATTGPRICFVPLAGVRGADDVPSAVLGAVAPSGAGLLQESARPTDALSKVVELLSGTETLLLLDNCEHLIDGAATVAARLLQDLPKLRVLATSREPLAITGEVLYQLGPLTMPQPGTDASAAASVRLFTDRARAVRHDFDLSSTVDAVTEICVRLDGMPLALELAAARLRSMSAAQIAARLDDRFRLLTSGSRTALPRHRTLRAVVSWSWDLLAEDEAVLAEELSVFPAPATLAALERVCTAGADAPYLVGSLVEKSIVVLVRTGPGEPRYRMLETIRAYAAERLAGRDATERTSAAFARYFAEFTERYEPMLRTRDQLTAIAALDADHDNAVGALRGAVQAGDGATAARLCLALSWYWTTVRGLNFQISRYIEGVLPLPGIPPHSAAILRAMSMTEAAVPGAMSPEQAHELIDDCLRTGVLEHLPHMSIVLCMLALLSRDDELMERETARAMASADTWSRGAAHLLRGFARAESSDVAASATARGKALFEFRSIGERWGMGMALGIEAEYQSRRGANAIAIDLLTDSLTMATELGSTDDMARHLLRLASERTRADDFAGARADLRAAEEVVARGTNEMMRTLVQVNAAELARRTGDLALAHRYLDDPDVSRVESMFPPEMIEEWLAVGRAALAVSDKDVASALAMLRRLLDTDSKADTFDLAQAAEVLARARAVDQAPQTAAFVLGCSEAIRGEFDAGNAELRTLVAELRDVLGADAYQAAYRAGAALSKKDAVAAVRADLAN